MEKEFCTYNPALRMKALGFDEPCFGVFYSSEDRIIKVLPSDVFNEKAFIEKGFLKAPTFSQCFRWFRVTYCYFHSIRIGINGFTYQISNMFDSSNPDKVFDFGEANIYSSTCTSGEGWYETFEEAELACLEKLLEIVESKSE